MPRKKTIWEAQCRHIPGVETKFATESQAKRHEIGVESLDKLKSFLNDNVSPCDNDNDIYNLLVTEANLINKLTGHIINADLHGD